MKTIDDIISAYNAMLEHARRWEDRAEVYRSQAIKFGDERDVANSLLEGAGILTGENRSLVERVESALCLLVDRDMEISRLRAEMNSKFSGAK